MVLVQNKYKNTLVGVLRTQITFVTHSSPSCYVTLRTQVIRLNSGNLDPQKTDSGVFIIIFSMYILCFIYILNELFSEHWVHYYMHPCHLHIVANSKNDSQPSVAFFSKPHRNHKINLY